MKALAQQRCQPQNGAPMNADAVAENLVLLNDWAFKNGGIEKTFSFKNFFETMAFVNALAWICHAEDHHPDLAVTYNRCVVRWSTHSVGGVSINDLICAAKANALAAA
jgi:4a-hydroxytetrahydrobiopterin dehydratase